MKDRVIIHDIREFLKTKPLFCLRCKNFTYTAGEYCENCGSKYSLREPTSKDVRQYNNAIRRGTQNQLKVQEFIKAEEFPTLEFNSDDDLKDFLYIERYFCIYCKKFTIRNRGYCENCGTRESLRKSKKKDIEQYKNMQELKRQEKLIQKQLKARRVLSEPKPDISQLKPKEIKTKLPTSEWKEKLKEIPIPQSQFSEAPEKPFLKSSQIKTLQPIPTSIKKEENVPFIPEILPGSTEKPITEISERKLDDLKPNIQPTLSKIEEKPKEIHLICKFCGMKLEQMVNFCYQCGTVIKHQ